MSDLHTGGCLCGSVRFELSGPLRGVVFCHCSKCRRFHGGPPGYTSVKRDQLTLTEDVGLTWFRSVTDETPEVHRGFCRVCGSSLFWDARGKETIAVAAGALDQPTGLETLGHIWLSQKADYYRIEDDLPRFPEGWGS